LDMGRMKQIEGQLELFDLFSEPPIVEDAKKKNPAKKNNVDNNAKVIKSKLKEKSKPEKTKNIDFFQECDLCWCSDCGHNGLGEAMPRDLCGELKPCPACESCRKNGKAEICEIGSAENGCMTRAIEAGQL